MPAKFRGKLTLCDVTSCSQVVASSDTMSPNLIYFTLKPRLQHYISGQCTKQCTADTDKVAQYTKIKPAEAIDVLNLNG